MAICSSKIKNFFADAVLLCFFTPLVLPLIADSTENNTLPTLQLSGKLDNTPRTVLLCKPLTIQRSKGRLFRNPKSAICNFRGFAYIALLVAIIIIGISLGAAGKYWSNVMLRDKEEELLYRGDQYRRAIERYVSAVPGSQVYPQSIDDLLKDSRTATGKRHLRQKYKDPISGEDFVEIRNTLTKRIIGVHSPSEKEPLKKAGFPDVYNTTQIIVQPGFPDGYNSFSDKMKYSEWLFVSTIKAVQTLPTGTRPFLTRPTPTLKQSFSPL